MPLRNRVWYRGLVATSVAVATLGIGMAQDKKENASSKQVSAGGPSADVKQAIERGLKFLRSRQSEKGYWTFEREVPQTEKSAATKFQDDPAFSLGLTALAALAMIENGVLPSDPAIQKAYNYIKEESVNNKRTYNLGLTIMFLTRLGSREDRPLIQRLARRLMIGQFDSGGWPYDCPMDVDRETSRTGLQGFTRKAGVGDNSNTQFGVMGLWAASRAGAQVDEALDLVAKRFRDKQAPTGGWDYASTGQADSNAMTVAGVYALTVQAAAASRKAAGGTSTKGRPAGKSSGSAPESPAGRPELTEDPVFQKGLSRVEQFVSGIGPGVSPYFLWSVERLGVTLQLQRFGEVDWYAQGSKALLESQRPDGSWELAWKGVPDSAFSLLFLRKAHLGRDISYALTGESSQPFVLIGKEKPQSFAKLSEAMAAAGDDEVIEIMGQGPFEVAGITSTGKTISVRGGEGFEPTLVHKMELLQDAEREPHLRYVFGVKGGRLTLEGLHIQMDPTARGNAAWTMISADGSELRVLNCSFTQSNSTSVTGIETRGASKLNLPP